MNWESVDAPGKSWGRFRSPHHLHLLRIPFGDGFIILTFPRLLCFSRGVGAGLFVALETSTFERHCSEGNQHVPYIRFVLPERVVSLVFVQSCYDVM